VGLTLSVRVMLNVLALRKLNCAVACCDTLSVTPLAVNVDVMAVAEAAALPSASAADAAISRIFRMCRSNSSAAGAAVVCLGSNMRSEELKPLRPKAISRFVAITTKRL